MSETERDPERETKPRTARDPVNDAAQKPVQPIFLLSLPRSGSTLLQRILAKHSAIDTAAEPWILLPLVSTMRSEGVYTNYDQNAVVDAIRDFYTAMPGGRATFTGALRDLALRLYTDRARPGARYFLDKTPRYHLILDEIFELFPDARFVFLWRNPLSVIASMLDTWHRGHWYLYFFKIDLYEGFERLMAAHEKYENRAFSIRYEDIISEPELSCKDLCRYLDIPFEPAMIDDFQSVDLGGEMGDPTGVKAYRSISDGSLDKWKQSLRNPIRKGWCQRYLTWLGERRLAALGYDLDELRTELHTIPFSMKRAGGDILRMTYGLVYQFLELRLLQDKLKRLPQLKRVHPHL
ncbi:MAG: sulfotransferase [Rhodothermales bacterium]|nr:sulfotransferase [Rhodothermales bacterium]